jgi:starch-binding outer membrane protein, SusD/RagB family
MTPYRFLGRRSLSRTAGAVAALALSLTACQTANDRLLGVVDPDIIAPGDLEKVDGAVALANGTIATFRGITGGGESTWLFGGLLADEWSTSSTFIQNDETDQRQIQLINSSITGMVRSLYRTRTRAYEAIESLKKFSPSSRATIAEMYLARGFAEMQLALDFCNGIPIPSNPLTNPPENGTPKTTAQVFALAAASLDTGLTFANGTDAASVQMNRSIRVVRARVALALGDFAGAGTLVAGLPTNFTYAHTFSNSTSTNTIWGQGLSSRRYSVGDSVEGNSRNILVANAIPFASTRDPRLPVTIPTSGSINGQDGQTFTRTTGMWGQLTSVDVVNGIDARMIEAEVALRNNNVTQWLAIHNALRAAPPRLGEIAPAAMAPLTDPGTEAARVNVHFREKAFWTFSRGQRLGDMRRLIRQYGRTEATVFPQGLHYKGGSYGKDVNLPITQPEENNPLFKGCTDRNP